MTPGGCFDKKWISGPKGNSGGHTHGGHMSEEPNYGTGKNTLRDRRTNRGEKQS